MARVRITWDFPDETDVKAVMKRVMLKMGTVALRTIVERTSRGLDVSGKPFAEKYSDRYRLVKSAAGRSPSRVDLNLSGQMMQGLMIKRATAEEVVLGWRPNRRRPIQLAARGKKFIVSDLATRARARRRVVARAKARTQDAELTNEELARLHHLGPYLPKNKQPARPFLGLSDIERRSIFNIGLEESRRVTRELNDAKKKRR